MWLIRAVTDVLTHVVLYVHMYVLWGERWVFCVQSAGKGHSDIEL